MRQLVISATAAALIGFSRPAPAQNAAPDLNATATAPHYEPAPMPNADIYAPLPPTDTSRSAQLQPQLYQPKNQFYGDGYSPGSTVQGREERTQKPAPGVAIKVPLD